MTEVLPYTRLAPMSHFHTLSKCTGAPQCTCRVRLHPNPPAWLHPYTQAQTYGAHGKRSPPSGRQSMITQHLLSLPLSTHTHTRTWHPYPVPVLLPMEP